ncbi:chemotaxis protein CheD [Pseudothauera nasutitermitis]|uniref:Probable chemoreceptor glutamine deamidase CheD n=1 Tax=Pseudothauera nasutitermitis TaxID=2565930 RepID=A0A4S4B2K2_9RHOO|nr:chemotaxis protein CheD [Pseudothauera nasutitermitis]THF65917.1 chemotaxis protein CheD [Pseudothauera nasutitermitis]
MSNADHLAGRELERIARVILPGAWAVEKERPIATLLGSCVAVALYDPQVGLGGLNHFMLPEVSRLSGRADVDALLAGNYAMEALLNAMLARGARKSRLVAKAFGGGMVVSSLDRSRIGQRNVEFTREWLERESIPLVASDFLGNCSRKVVLEPRSGDVFCRRAPSSLAVSRQIDSQEQAYAERLVTERKRSDIELF